MTHLDEVQTFRAAWNAEAQCTLRLLDVLPPDQYDFRPDPKGRSLGEMAWHLSEIDACLSFGIALRRFRFEDEPPDLKRPREIKLLAPGYRHIHDQAVVRLDGLRSDQLEDTVTFFDGRRLTIRHVLWNELLPGEACDCEGLTEDHASRDSFTPRARLTRRGLNGTAR